eukprot:3381292-Rhodomonas_salina.1
MTRATVPDSPRNPTPWYLPCTVTRIPRYDGLTTRYRIFSHVISSRSPHVPSSHALADRRAHRKRVMMSTFNPKSVSAFSIPVTAFILSAPTGLYVGWQQHHTPGQHRARASAD